jgi:ABC-type sugar transport system ATPase subunit
MLALTKLMDRLPSELSGGERQRVAMGRAIVRRPRVFLFDEPLSNLDAALRQDLRVQIGVLVRELGVTAIYVTHDQVEAMTLADRICLMKRGEVQQVAAPRTIYESPATSFVGTFIGAPKMNLLEGTVSDGRVTCGPFELPASGDLPKNVVVGVRPEDVKITDGVFSNPELTVAVAEPLGAETNLVLKGPNDLTLRARTHGFDPRAPGAKVNVSLDGARFHVFEAGEGGRRL